MEIKNKQQIEKMRTAGKKAAETLLAVGELIKPGITGLDIDNFVKEYTKKLGGQCAPYGYRQTKYQTPFPGYVCISPGHVVCHGIPNKKPLDNMIFNVDITTIFNEAYGDTSAMFYIGNISEKDMLLMKTCHECLNLGISQIKHNIRVGDIGNEIVKHAENFGFSVVTDYGGHGIGIGPNGFHMDPRISHYGKAGLGTRLPAGLTHTLEPMLNAGEPFTFVDEKDTWTVYASDLKNSAQWEHTILVTESGYEILTKREEKLKNSIETT